jgi:hypothetical protein
MTEVYIPAVTGKRGRSGTRCPFAPLRAVIEQQYGEWNPREMARQVGVSPRTVDRWAQRGSVKWFTFDHIAIKLGRHPDELLPGWHP